MCPDCKDTGRVKCGTCAGRGKVHGDTCMDCEGKATFACPAAENPHPGGYCPKTVLACWWCRETASEQGERLQPFPLSQREAFAFVAEHHRHHDEPRGFKFAIGASWVGVPVGVVIVGRPVSRRLQEDCYLAEVTRLCVLEYVNHACSFLYAAAWRCARAMGYRRCGTYTLPTEGGASLRAAGWRLIGDAGGGTWDRKDRPRIDTHPTQGKLRWEVAA